MRGYANGFNCPFAALRGLAEEITNSKIDRIVMAGMNILFAKNAFFGVYRLFFIKTKLLSDIL